MFFARASWLRRGNYLITSCYYSLSSRPYPKFRVISGSASGICSRITSPGNERLADSNMNLASDSLENVAISLPVARHFVRQVWGVGLMHLGSSYWLAKLFYPV